MPSLASGWTREREALEMVRQPVGSECDVCCDHALFREKKIHETARLTVPMNRLIHHGDFGASATQIGGSELRDAFFPPQDTTNDSFADGIHLKTHSRPKRVFFAKERNSPLQTRF